MAREEKRSVPIVAPNRRSFLVPQSDAKRGASASTAGTSSAPLLSLSASPSSTELLRLTCGLLRCEQPGLVERGLDLCGSTAATLLREAEEKEEEAEEVERERGREETSPGGKAMQSARTAPSTATNLNTTVTPQSTSALYSPQEGGTSAYSPEVRSHSYEEGEELMGAGIANDQPTTTTTTMASDYYRTPQALRVQAVYLLVAGAVVAMGQHGVHTMQQRALELAERAWQRRQNAMTAHTLAMACYTMAMSYTDAERQTYWLAQAVTVARHTTQLYAAEAANATTVAADRSQEMNANSMSGNNNNNNNQLGGVSQPIIALGAGPQRPALPAEDDIPFLSRLCWLLAQCGQMREARPCNAAVLQLQPTHYMALLLSALDSSAAADYDSSTATTLLLLQHYTEDTVAALLLAVLQYTTTNNYNHHNNTSSSSSHENNNNSTKASHALAEKELAVALARAQAFAAQPQPLAGAQHTLKSLCLHAGPYESPVAAAAGEARLSPEEWRGRAAGHWALVAKVCTQLGAYEMAEVACEAGTEFVQAIAHGKTTPRRAYAALLCHRVRLFLASVVRPRVAAAVAAACSRNFVLRDARFLALRLHEHNSNNSSSSGSGGNAELPSFRASLPLSAETSATDEFTSEREAARAALAAPIASGEWLALWSQLTRALELWPDEGEAFHLMGCMHLMQACPNAHDALGVRAEEREGHLDEAVRCFETALRHAPRLTEAYYGLGAAREEQKMCALSVDAYATAAELAAQEPLLSYTDLAYLYK